MQKCFIVLRSWNRNCDNAHRETSGVAYPTKKAAFQGIAEDIAEILENESVPEGTVFIPQPVADEENSSHDHGALKFLPGDIASCCQVEIHGPLPEGIDDPRMADFYECFEIEEFDVTTGNSLVASDREYLTEDVMALYARLVDGGHDAGNPLRVKGTVQQALDGPGYIDYGTPVPVDSLYYSGGRPFALLRFPEGNGRTEAVPLTAVEHIDSRGDVEASWWRTKDIVFPER